MSSSTLISTEGSPTLSVSGAAAATSSSSASSSSSSSISSSFFFSDSFNFIPPSVPESVNRTSRSRRFYKPASRGWQYPRKGFYVTERTPRTQAAACSARELVDLEDGQQNCHDDRQDDEPHDDDQQRLQDAQHRGKQAVHLALLMISRPLEHTVELAARLAARDQVNGHRRKELRLGE